MDQEFIKEIREKLVEEKKKIEKELKTVSKNDKSGRFPGDAEATFPEYGDSLEENTDEVITYQENLSASSNLENYVGDVEKAIEKIDQGTYGVCEKCNIEISEDRIKAFPAARICIDCSKK